MFLNELCQYTRRHCNNSEANQRDLSCYFFKPFWDAYPSWSYVNTSAKSQFLAYLKHLWTFFSSSMSLQWFMKTMTLVSTLSRNDISNDITSSTLHQSFPFRISSKSIRELKSSRSFPRTTLMISLQSHCWNPPFINLFKELVCVNCLSYNVYSSYLESFFQFQWEYPEIYLFSLNVLFFPTIRIILSHWDFVASRGFDKAPNPSWSYLCVRPTCVLKVFWVLTYCINSLSL